MSHLPADATSVVLAAAEALTLEELGGETAAHLKRLVGATGVTLYRHRHGGGLDPLAGDLRPVLSEYGPNLSLSDPTQQRPYHLEPRPRVVLATRSLPRGALERSVAYVDFYRRYDIGHAACVWLTDRPYASPGMTGIVLTRPRSRDEFDRREALLLQSVLPALNAAVRRCERMEALRCRDEGLDALAQAIERDGCFVVDGDGLLLWMSDKAREALAGQPVPPEILDEARRLCVAAEGRVRSADPPALDVLPSAQVTLRPGVAARAELQLLRSRADRRLVVVRLRPVERKPPGDRVGARFGLTPAESRVLRLVALGLTNAEIARRLDVSIETARTHVHNILAKLGVTTRARAGAVAWSEELEELEEDPDDGRGLIATARP